MDWNDSVQKWMRITCAVFGLVLIGISMLLLYIGSSVDNAMFRYGVFIVAEEFANTSRAAILMGVFMLGILWLQITGAVREWAFLMFLNAMLLGYLVILGGFLIQAIKSDEIRLSSQLYYGMLTSLKRYGEDSNYGVSYRKGWTHVQISKNCCGTNNYTDWEDVSMIPHDPMVPISCCKNRIAFCSNKVKFQNVTHDSQFIYVKGCFSEVKADVPLPLLGQVVIPFEIVGILSALMSAYLSWQWRSRGSERATHRMRNPNQITGHENLIEDSIS